MQLSKCTACRHFFSDVLAFLAGTRVSTSAPLPGLSGQFVLPVKSIFFLTLQLILLKKLEITFNNQTFYFIADIFSYIGNFSIGFQRVELFYDILKQTAFFFNVSSSFVKEVIKAVKKDKSFKLVDCHAKDIAELLEF